LTEVRGQIDRLRGRLNSLSRRTDYSEISLQFVPEGVALNRPGWQPSAELAAAFKTLLAVLQFAATAAIWVGIVGSPFLLALAAIVYIWRRRRRGPAPAST